MTIGQYITKTFISGRLKIAISLHKALKLTPKYNGEKCILKCKKNKNKKTCTSSTVII